MMMVRRNIKELPLSLIMPTIHCTLIQCLLHEEDEAGARKKITKCDNVIKDGIIMHKNKVVQAGSILAFPQVGASDFST